MPPSPQSLDAPIPTNINAIAILCPTWVGDTVMATPILRALRTHRPNTRITALVRPGHDQLLEGSPWLDDIVTLDAKGALGPWRAARTISALNLDAMLLLPNSFRSALTARFAGVSRRIGYDRDHRKQLLTHALPIEAGDAPSPTVDYYAQLACFALGVESIDPTLELHISQDQHAAADALLEDVPGPFALLNPGAVRAAKRWPAERFAHVADALHKDHGWSICITGAPNERDIIDAVIDAASTPIINLMQRGVTLGSLKAVAQRSEILITNDTGPRHIAAAVQTPIVSLFGPTDRRWTTLASARERTLLAEPFLPEQLVADQHAKLCAIERISVGDVRQAVEILLAEPPSADR